MVTVSSLRAYPAQLRTGPADTPREGAADDPATRSSTAQGDPVGSRTHTNPLPGSRREATGTSSLPTLSLEDVLEQQSVVVLTSEETGESVVVSLDESAESGDPVDVAFVSGADIEALYTRATLHGPDVDGDTRQSSSPSNVLLLNNGWAYLALESSPLELPIEPASVGSDGNWSPWRLGVDGLHEIQDLATGLWSRLRGTLIDTSPKTHADASGDYRSASMSSSVMNTSTSWKNLELSSEGLFSVSRTTLVSGGGVDPEDSFIMHLHNSISERSNTFIGVTRSEHGVASTTRSQSDELARHVGDLFGSWEILEDGVTLELRFADGRVERRLFLQAEDSPALSIDGTTWWRQADASPDLLATLMQQLTDPEHGRSSRSWASVLADADLKLEQRSNPSRRGSSDSSDAHPPSATESHRDA